MNYKFTVPPTREVGSYSGTCSPSIGETYRQNALWDYNTVRARDGHPPLKRMPAGTNYFPVYEYQIQMWTGKRYGWECVNTECAREDAKRSIREYRDNQPGAYRIRRVRA